MAIPIKQTPVLRGKDARKFERNIHDNAKKPVPASDYKRATHIYRELKKKSSVWA